MFKLKHYRPDAVFTLHGSKYTIIVASIIISTHFSRRSLHSGDSRSVPG